MKILVNIKKESDQVIEIPGKFFYDKLDNGSFKEVFLDSGLLSFFEDQKIADFKLKICVAIATQEEVLQKLKIN